jgi:glycosyltransferase involved in cell wall biosynthesis
MLETVAREAHRFDVIHYHIDYLHYVLSRRLAVPNATTLHGRLNIPELGSLYDEFAEMPVVSISNDQRKPLPQANWQATVYHGLPSDLLKFGEQPRDYLAFLGRISPEKRVDRAIEIARRVGMKLRIAAKVDAADAEYFRTQIEPLLSKSDVEFVGEIGEREKSDFLGNAKALLFPIDWPEPFGLVMIESLACGTPVIAWNCGSVPEVIDNGITGFVVDSLDEAVQAVEKCCDLDRRRIRQVFDKRFSSARMALDYVAVYRHLIGRNSTSSPGGRVRPAHRSHRSQHVGLPAH